MPPYLEFPTSVILSLALNYIIAPLGSFIYAHYLLSRRLYENARVKVPKFTGYLHFSSFLVLVCVLVFDVFVRNLPYELFGVLPLTLLSLVIIGQIYINIFMLPYTFLPMNYDRKKLVRVFLERLVAPILLIFVLSMFIYLVGVRFGIFTWVLGIRSIILWFLMTIATIVILCFEYVAFIDVSEDFTRRSRVLIEKFVGRYGVLSLGILTRNYTKLGLSRKVGNARNVITNISLFVELPTESIIVSDEIVIIPEVFANYIMEHVVNEDKEKIVQKMLELLGIMSEELMLEKIESFRLLISAAFQGILGITRSPS